MSTFSAANITDGNLLLKECTHRIKIKYSMHQYSIRLHNLGNWLIVYSVYSSEHYIRVTLCPISLQLSRPVCKCRRQWQPRLSRFWSS